MWKISFIILLLVSNVVNGETTKKRVCIVGAGISGLYAAKSFNEFPNEFETIVFEKNSEVGGLWIYTDNTTVDEHGLPVHSSLYKNLWTNTVKEMTSFPGYPLPGGKENEGRFLKHEIILDYLRNYTTHFNLSQYIQFNSNVEKIEPLPLLRWLIVSRNLNNKEISRTTCDAVVLCNGHNVKGYTPEIREIGNFSGQVLHSHVYRKPDSFVNQTVVVMGASVSGIDISVDISSVAKKVYISHRHKKIPCTFPSNIEQIPNVSAANGSKLVLCNGTEIQADALILCTGYRYNFPFLDESSGITIVNETQVRPMYKHLINIERPTMAIIGLPLRSYYFMLVPAQVNYFRAVLRGQLSLPSHEQMLLEAQIATSTSSGKRHVTSFGEFFKYYDELRIPVDGQRLPWWVPRYMIELRKLLVQDFLHFREKKFVINEANRTAKFVTVSDNS